MGNMYANQFQSNAESILGLELILHHSIVMTGIINRVLKMAYRNFHRVGKASLACPLNGSASLPKN